MSAESPLVDVTSKEIGGNITSETLVQLPSVNGNFIGFVGLLPGIVPSISTESFGSDSISVNGQDPRNNNYMLDGGNNNDDVIGQRAGTQARTPIEAIQEFQVVTDQFDAEFGRTAGAIINAVTKQGTNRMRGSAFGYFQRGGLTDEGLLREGEGAGQARHEVRPLGRHGRRPDRQGQAALLRQPRTVFDRPAQHDQHSGAAGPERARTPTEDRVWNTIVRGDHQVSANNTYSVRWLRETSPQLNQIIGPSATQSATLASAREESDVDQTLSANVNSVLSHTKVSTLRLTWTRENVAFANHCFNTNGRDLSKCQPSLLFQDFIDQQDNTAQSRINDGIQVDETLAWFLPGKHGDHDIKFGAQYRVLRRAQREPGQSERHLHVRPERPAVQRGESATYPDRFTIRVGGPSNVSSRRPLRRRLRAGQVALQPAPDAEPRPAVRPRDHPDPETDDPLVSKYPVDRNNFAAAPRHHLRHGRRQERRARRLRPLLRQVAPRADRRPLDRHAVHELLRRDLPDGRPDLGPRNGNLPTDPFLVNGPTINHDAAEPAVSRRPAAAEHGRDLGQRGSPQPLYRPDDGRLRASAAGGHWRSAPTTCTRAAATC